MMRNRITISKEYSERLLLLRFPLIVGVVFIHSYGVSVSYSDKSIAAEHLDSYVIFIQNLLSNGIGRVAVPMFFLLSGYFFFINFKFSFESYARKLSSRCKTLLIPFLFWNIAMLLILWLVQLFPQTLGYFPDKKLIISNYDLYEIVNAVLGIDRFPIAYQFWFIRDLMIVVLMVPLFVFILRIIPTLSLLMMGGAWFFSFWGLQTPSITALFFFYLGGYLAYSGKDIFLMDKFGVIILSSYLAVLVIDTYYIHAPYHRYLHKTGLLLGISSALYITSHAILCSRFKSLLVYASGAGFFVFATHEPLLTVLKKISYILFKPASECAVLVIYITTPIVVVATCLLTYYLWHLLFPRFLGIITGGR